MTRSGRDDLASSQFAHSIHRTIGMNRVIADANITEEAQMRESEKVSRKMANGDFAIINLDTWVEVRCGKRMYFEKIWLEERDAGVRTMNSLRKVARLVWIWSLQLKTCTPPKGMEGLRSINIIKQFDDPLQEDHRAHIENGKLVIDNPKTGEREQESHWIGEKRCG